MPVGVIGIRSAHLIAIITSTTPQEIVTAIAADAIATTRPGNGVMAPVTRNQEMATDQSNIRKIEHVILPVAKQRDLGIGDAAVAIIHLRRIADLLNAGVGMKDL